MKMRDHIVSMFRLFNKFTASVVPQLMRPLQILWNQLLGTIFLALACAPLLNALRTWRRQDTADPAHVVKMGLTVVFVAVMAGFSIHAFWRARKVGRS